MAEADVDTQCCEYFQYCVEKEKAKKLSLAEKKQGKGTTVRKIIKDGLGEKDPGLISYCESSIMSKHQDKRTKQISDEDFVMKMLPELAAKKAKCKVGEPAANAELTKMKTKMCGKLAESKNPTAKKDAAVVSRLTDSKGYTGAHKERFDAKGQGKGKAGREDQVDDSGYVGAYKNKGTFDKK